MNLITGQEQTITPAQRCAPIAAAASRREFMRTAAVLTALTVGGKVLASTGGDTKAVDLSEDRMAVLVDLTRCVGCRRCEWACAGANDNPHGPIEEYDQRPASQTRRNLQSDQFCIVNKSQTATCDNRPVFAKIQCMHCERPPCVSACLVGAMQKDPSGPVTYDASKCIGCRYCLVACPFERLTYEFQSALTPRVRKCEFCRHRTERGQLPACVEICPVEALQYGRREDLLAHAHGRIAKHPDKYVNHVYGETEGGGTSWLYLSPVPFEELVGLGLPSLPSRSPAERSEHIQHTIFKFFAGPIAVATLLTSLNWMTRRGDHA